MNQKEYAVHIRNIIFEDCNCCINRDICDNDGGITYGKCIFKKFSELVCKQHKKIKELEKDNKILGLKLKIEYCNDPAFIPEIQAELKELTNDKCRKNTKLH